MNLINNNNQHQALSSPYSLVSRQIVASILTHQGQLALFKRSQKVCGDRGLWHCITGFIDSTISPLAHARGEVEEEAGICASQLSLVNSDLVSLDDDQQQRWTIHVFHFETTTRLLKTNWENDAATWLSLGALSRFETVGWLPKIIDTLQLQQYLRTSCEADEPLLICNGGA